MGILHRAPSPVHSETDRRLDDAAAYGAWLDGLTLPAYPDEAPELDLPDWEPEPEDRAWWAEQVALMESQRPDCLGLPETLAYLDAQLDAARAHLDAADLPPVCGGGPDAGVVRRSMIIREVAEFLSRNRDGHDGTEGGA